MLPLLAGCGSGSGQDRVSAGGRRRRLAGGRAAAADAPAVRALVRQPRGRSGGHGSLRLGPPLGALAARRWASRCDCCLRPTCAPTSSATRPMRPTPARCSKRRAAPTSCRCASRASSSRRCRRCTATRSLWMATRTARINTLRGFCREFGIAIAQGSRSGIEQIGRVLADPHSAVPPADPPLDVLLVEEVRLLEARIGQLERELTALAQPIARLHHAAVDSRHRPAHRHGDGGSDLAARSATSRTRGTSPPGSGSRPRNTRRAAPAISGASASAATATCACCSRTGHAPCCARPPSRSARQDR